MNELIRGFAFPFRIDPARGGVASQSGDDKIKENIIHILTTGIGERMMRRDYGGGVRQLVHDPTNDALAAIVKHQIAKAVGRFEPRVLVQDIKVTMDGSSLIVSVQYIVRRTRQARKLSVPIGLGGI